VNKDAITTEYEDMLITAVATKTLTYTCSTTKATAQQEHSFSADELTE